MKRRRNKKKKNRDGRTAADSKTMDGRVADDKIVDSRNSSSGFH